MIETRSLDLAHTARPRQAATTPVAIRHLSPWDQIPLHLVRRLALQEHPVTELLDPLTSLLHRTAFLAVLDDYIEHNEPLSLILIDLDAFRDVNDALGHDEGDALLRRVAHALLRIAEPTAVIARTDGDEFAIILPETTTEDQLRLAMDRFHVALRKVTLKASHALVVQASMGGVIYPHDASSRTELLKFADIALSEAKRAGGDRAKSFRPQLLSSVQLRANMRSRASDCLRRPGRLLTYYQPKVDLKSGSVVGYEALLRCLDDRNRLRGPSWILAAFNDAALAVALGAQIRRETLCYAKRLQDSGDNAKIALNVTSWELQDPEWPQLYLDEASRFELCPSSLEIEITESVILGVTARTSLKALEYLHARGVTITLDDFGTGFASLTHLRSCPIDGLKIDRSFIRDLSQPDTAAIVKTIIELGQALRMTVVAEGIESIEQHNCLKGWGCDQGQGFLYGRPVPAPGLLMSKEFYSMVDA